MKAMGEAQPSSMLAFLSALLCSALPHSPEPQQLWAVKQPLYWEQVLLPQLQPFSLGLRCLPGTPHSQRLGVHVLKQAVNSWDTEEPFAVESHTGKSAVTN